VHTSGGRRTISATLIGVLLAYAVVGTGLSILIGHRLIGLNYQQYQKEADFRYSLVRVRDNAESIAFNRGEKREGRDLLKRLGRAVLNMLDIIGWNRNLSFFTSSYYHAAFLRPIIIVSPLLMRGEVEFGVVPNQPCGFPVGYLLIGYLKPTGFHSLVSLLRGHFRVTTVWE
jgi:vitamin B12/bleomycin/antimicrobial peptide transport system ATP-binding/permease protein